jgi:hypothetical protein
MAMRDVKRENFEVTPEQEANINCLQGLLNASTRKETFLRAVDLTIQVVQELRNGKMLFVGNNETDRATRLLIPGVTSSNGNWKYLVEHSHPWKKQLYVKGRKLPAVSVWIGMETNGLTRAEAAENWDIPIDVVNEIVDYCQNNRDLLRMEADEEKRLLKEKGISIESKVAYR